ncbi:DUF5005 domain-containing protein [Sinomicrobium soli]|uniref:DUF5005 domain-containing protein n=1 Tax=Sinomicrobium sp. N-1-3-6 TaxID=2219864 RepID=UPI000DCECEFB|nr:DUF5005 domain-containing protein [Sinomicrobium sp. N-1-3-6]RAV30510.1 hypothetical protein DN748_03160 [Sinomicrobium sp. N-1-3-6]
MNLRKSIYTGILGSMCTVLVLSCKDDVRDKNTEKDPLSEEMTFSVERAPEWTAVFRRDSGWFGGDGIFAIPYSGEDSRKEADSIIFLFSDTMVGEIIGDSLVPGYSMVNNSMALYQKGEKPGTTEFFLAEDSEGKAAAMLVPDTEQGEYYWLGDGFADRKPGGKLYVFAYRIRNTGTDDLLPFEETGNDLLVIDKNKVPLHGPRTLHIPFFGSGESPDKISFGVGIHDDREEEHVYIYGVRGQDKELVCARVNYDKIEDFDAWEFRKADGWTRDREQMTALTDSVSNELSMSRLPDGRYALIYQYGGIYPNIYMQIGETPYGPFGDRKEIWNTTEDVNDPDLFTYNAKAHPAISGEGELLVSYNVNSFKFFDVIENMPHLYRPRFIRIKFGSEHKKTADEASE